LQEEGRPEQEDLLGPKVKSVGKNCAVKTTTGKRVRKVGAKHSKGLGIERSWGKDRQGPTSQECGV